MRYSLLNYLECPASRTELVCLTTREARTPLPHYKFAECRRANQAGAVVGPIPGFRCQTALTGLLSAMACPAADPSRDAQVAVKEGILVSGETSRWYPIRDFIPELLPDQLRDFERDFAFLRALKNSLPDEIFAILNDESVFSRREPGGEEGINYKLAELGVKKRVDDEFFGPGYLSPFNPHNKEHSAHLVKTFGFSLSLLQAGNHHVVLDTGCGYAWTTEWLLRAGFEPIGTDITRAYLEVGLARLGLHRPHLLIADTENLPIRGNSVDAVLGYESFHHIPNRNRAMHEFDRVLVQGGEVVLCEPNAAHEHDAGSIAVMEKHGILERGMDLADVAQYIEGTSFLPPKQELILRVSDPPAASPPPAEYLSHHNWSANNLFTIRKPSSPPADETALELEGQREILDVASQVRGEEAVDASELVPPLPPE